MAMIRALLPTSVISAIAELLVFTLEYACLTTFFMLFIAGVFIVVVEKCDAAPVALQLSTSVTTVAPVYRQVSPGTVVNLSQRTNSASLTGVTPSPLVNVFTGATSSVAGSSGGLGRPVSATTTTQATVLHTIRPVTTQAVNVCILKQYTFLATEYINIKL